MRLLQFCLDATYLAYRGEFFQQTFGTAMGSPSISDSGQPGDGKCRGESTVYVPIPASLLERYVDDTVTALPQDQVQGLLAHLNTIEESIQFTVEEETDGRLGQRVRITRKRARSSSEGI